MAQQEKQPWGEVERAAGVWDEPLKLQARAAKDGVCERIFPCSPSNFFHAKADQWRDEAWEIIRQTPNLVYFVLTKRPPRILSHLPMDWPSVSRDQIVLVGAGALAEFQIAGELN
jgi:protein gp37